MLYRYYVLPKLPADSNKCEKAHPVSEEDSVPYLSRIKATLDEETVETKESTLLTDIYLYT